MENGNLNSEVYAMDNLLTLSQAAQALPNKPAPSTIWRWCKRGMPMGDDRIYLDYKRVGRRVYIPSQALHDFIEEVSAADKKTARRDREADIAAAERRVMGRE